MKSTLLAVLMFVMLIQVQAQTGIPVPQMTQADNLINNFMATYDIPGGTVALAKDGKIVYMRAFGYEDVNKTIPTQPYNLFRIASLSKQITSIAIMKMMQNGQLSMSDKVFGPTGILKDHPVFSKANITDTRIYDITIQNLLEHSGGWNRDLNCNPNPTTPYPYFLGGCDPISFPLRVTMLEGTTNPVKKEDHIKFLLEKGLDFAPGTQYNYSNIGFLMLGEVIEKISGMSYEDYVKSSVLAPLGIYDMHIAKNLKTEKQEREGEYVGNGYTTLSCYGDGTYVPWEYGGFSVNAMDAHGGWIASGRDMLKLLTAVDGFSTKPDILTPASITVMTTPSATNQNYAKGWQVNSYNNWWHTGALDGTASEQVRSSNGYTWILIFNKRNITNNNFWSDLDNLGWNCIGATSSWPSWDLMASPTVNASAINFTNQTNNSITVNWANGNGTHRMLLVKEASKVDGFPLDGTDYAADAAYGSGANVGNGTFAVYNGTGNSTTVTGLTLGATYYFRVVEYTKNTTTGNNALYLLGNNPEAIQAVSGPLPVSLSYFNAHKISASAAELSWQTQQEINSSLFQIERSNDGTHFSLIGSLAAKGNAASKSTYMFIDKSPLVDKNYYRLKQIDKDLKYTYSNVVSLDFRLAKTKYKIITYQDKTSFTIIKSNEADFANAVFVIRDVAGKTLIRQALSNVGTQIISGQNISKGIYFATIINGEDTYTQKVIMQ